MYIRFITVLSMILTMAVSSTAAFAEPVDPQPEDPLALVSCADACGGMAESGCWCDSSCTDFGDCCPDYHSTCELPEVESSCADACGGPGAGDCWCDDACADYGDCCADYLDTCDPIEALPTCVDNCGGQSAAGCWCDEFCADFGDCCDDHDAACTPVSSDVDAHLVPLSEPVAGIPFDLVLSMSSPSGAHASAVVSLSLNGVDRADLIEHATERVSADGQTRVLRLQQVVLDEGAHTARFEVDGEAFERDLHVGSASPPIYVARVFSELIEEQMIPLTEPAPGAVVSVVVNGVTAGADAALWVELADGPVVEAAMVLDLEAWFVPAEVSSNLAVVAFTLPEFLPEGLMKLRVHIDDQHSRWVPLEVSNQGATRTELGDLLAEQLAEPLTGLVVTAPYRSLPSGALLENGLTGEPVHTIQHDGTWLFFAFDPTSGFEQDTALWILVDPEGAIETIEGQGAWPDVLVDGQATFADVGASLMLQSASSWVGPWARKDPPSQVTNTYPSVPLITRTGDGQAFSGRVAGTCPNGIRKIGLILQLDDRSGFDWLSDEMERRYQAWGMDEIYSLTTDHLHRQRNPTSPISPDFTAVDEILREKLSALEDDDCCTEIVITLLSHGLKKGLNVMRFEQDGTLHRFEVPFVNVLAVVDGALRDTQKTCIPVTMINHSCFSGSAIDPSEDYIDEQHPTDADKPDIEIVGSSSATQKSGGVTEGPSSANIFFLRALETCIALDSNGDGLLDNDTNRDGTVTLEEAWACVKKLTDQLSDTHAGRSQNPTKANTGD